MLVNVLKAKTTFIYMSKDDFHVVLKKNAARKYLAAKLSVV